MSDIGFRSKKMAILAALNTAYYAAKGIRWVLSGEESTAFDEGMKVIREFLGEAKDVSSEEEARALMQKYEDRFPSDDEKYVKDRLTYWNERLKAAEDDAQAEKALAIIVELQQVYDRL